MTPRQSLEAKLTELGSNQALADHFCVSAPYMSQIIHCHRPIPDWMALSLGFVQRWVKIGE
jgi:DNA-binding transcriptional regulator YdaS (Cro superfamily)